MEEKFFDIDMEVTEGEWFPFQTSKVDPDTGKIIWDDPIVDDKGNPIASLRIRLMTPFYEERFAKRSRVTEHVFNPKTRAMERVTSLKELSMDEIRSERDDAIDYAITGIKGFRDKATQKPLPLTRDNKLAMLKTPAIDRFFAYCQERLSQSMVEQKVAEAENFTSGSSGRINTSQE